MRLLWLNAVEMSTSKRLDVQINRSNTIQKNNLVSLATTQLFTEVQDKKLCLKKAAL